jgi:hypothetical protein
LFHWSILLCSFYLRILSIWSIFQKVPVYTFCLIEQSIIPYPLHVFELPGYSNLNHWDILEIVSYAESLYIRFSRSYCIRE